MARAALLFLLLTLHLTPSWSHPSPPSDAAAEPAVCSLVLRGGRISDSGETGQGTAPSLHLKCTSASHAGVKVPVAINPNTTGLNDLSVYDASGATEGIDEDCKQQAAALPLTPAIFFCGNYSITLANPVVHGIGRASANATASSSLALLAFGGHVKAAISNGSFVENRVGAVVLLLGNASLVVNKSAFSSNTLNGSCISATDASSLVVDNSTFTNNNASPPAALVALDGGTALRIAGSANASCNACVISGNKAEGWGGGVRTLGSARLTMRSCLLRNNSAQQGGSLWAGETSRVSSLSI
jgi:hypothetical protein